MHALHEHGSCGNHLLLHHTQTNAYTRTHVPFYTRMECKSNWHFIMNRSEKKFMIGRSDYNSSRMTKLTWFQAWPLQAHTGKIFLVPCLPRCPESVEPVNKANLMSLASSIHWVLLFWFSSSQKPVAACRHRFSYSHEWFSHIWRKNVPILGANRHRPTATLMEGKKKRKKREENAKFTLMFGRSMKFLAMWTTSLSMKAGAM